MYATFIIFAVCACKMASFNGGRPIEIEAVAVAVTVVGLELCLEALGK